MASRKLVGDCFGAGLLGLSRSIRHTLVSVVGLVALGNIGCATTIARRYPHLDRRPVCVLVPGIENDSTEYLITNDGVPVSNFHPEVVDRVAARNAMSLQV